MKKYFISKFLAPISQGISMEAFKLPEVHIIRKILDFLLVLSLNCVRKCREKKKGDHHNFYCFCVNGSQSLNPTLVICFVEYLFFLYRNLLSQRSSSICFIFYYYYKVNLKIPYPCIISHFTYLQGYRSNREEREKNKLHFPRFHISKMPLILYAWGLGDLSTMGNYADMTLKLPFMFLSFLNFQFWKLLYFVYNLKDLIQNI